MDHIRNALATQSLEPDIHSREMDRTMSDAEEFANAISGIDRDELVKMIRLTFAATEAAKKHGIEKVMSALASLDEDTQ
jgi:uncharacterized protein YjgD (DUF1641 family)